MSYMTNGVETIMPPPDGYVVNFDDPPQIGKSQIFAVCIVENILALSFLAQRLYTKLFLMRSFQIEEVTLLLAWATSVATQAHLLQLYVVKAVGVHAWEMPLERYAYFSQIIFAAPLIYTVTVGASKATLCLFYRRLSPFHSFQYWVWVTMVTCVGSSVGIFFSLLFACRPIAASWDPILALTATCLDRGAIYVATAGLGVLTDVLLLALPIPTVMGLQIRMRQKVGLVLLFTVGSITFVTSIVRLIILLPSLSNQDQTYALTQGTLWICIESNLLIMCCCLPTLRQFVKHVAPSIIGEKSTEGSDEPRLRYALHTFGGGSSGQKGYKSSRFDSLMRTQATRLDDGDSMSPEERKVKVDPRYPQVTDIRGGNTESSSHDKSRDNSHVTAAGYESDEVALNSRTVTVEVNYEPAASQRRVQ